jgi:hypothetical protein
MARTTSGMVKKIATALLLFGIGSLFVLWFISDLRSDASVGAWNYVFYVVGALLFIGGGVGTLLPDRPEHEAHAHDGIQIVDEQTVAQDGVMMTVHQAALMDAMRQASRMGSDATVRIGVDPATGQPRYDVVRRA